MYILIPLSEFVELFLLYSLPNPCYHLFEVICMTKECNPSMDSLTFSKMLHEIKNPLTFIYSSLQLIQEDHPDVQDFRFWNQTLDDVKNLRSLLDELSRFQKGDILNKTKIHLFDFTEDLLESAAAFLLESGTTLTYESTVEDLDFYGDEQKLRHAILNLLKNAVESSPAQSPILLRMTTEDSHLLISVTDWGCGIAEDQIPKILEPFHTTKSYGTGLGLPIVKKIAEAHQGSLRISSSLGVGSTFSLCLPLA